MQNIYFLSTKYSYTNIDIRITCHFLRFKVAELSVQ